MAYVKVNLSKAQLHFLQNYMVHEDAANSVPEAIKICIDDAIRIEKRYFRSATDIAFNGLGETGDSYGVCKDPIFSKY